MKTTLHQLVMLIQGVYYVVTGLWPLVHAGSFEAITGPKSDKFTLRTTSTLIVIIGSILMIGSLDKKPHSTLTALGVASALGLAGLEVLHSGRVRFVYLLEAPVEVTLAGLLLGTAKLRR